MVVKGKKKEGKDAERTFAYTQTAHLRATLIRFRLHIDSHHALKAFSSL